MSRRRQCGSLLTSTAIRLVRRHAGVEIDADVHLQLLAQFEQAGNQRGQIAGQIGQIDEHVHDEMPADDALLDVFDIDAALGHVRGELGNHAFLVLADDADDR